MTQDEFLKRYHSYRVLCEEQARREAAGANEEGIDVDRAVAVHFPKLGWRLMLRGAVVFMHEIDPNDPTWQEALDAEFL